MSTKKTKKIKFSHYTDHLVLLFEKLTVLHNMLGHSMCFDYKFTIILRMAAEAVNERNE